MRERDGGQKSPLKCEVLNHSDVLLEVEKYYHNSSTFVGPKPPSPSCPEYEKKNQIRINHSSSLFAMC